MKKILIIDDEESIRFTFKTFLSDEGYEVATVDNYDKALEIIDERNVDMIFADIILGDKTGIDVLRKVREKDPNCPVVMITGYPHIDSASDALRLGAFDYIPKPVQQDTLLQLTKKAIQHRALVNEKEKYRLNLEAIFRSVNEGIITVDKDMSVLSINEAAENICGYSRDTIGVTFSELPKLCYGKCIEVLEETISKKKPVQVYRHECSQVNNRGKVVTLTTSPLIDSYGLFSGAVLVIRDETLLTNLERDLRELHQFHNIIGKDEKMQNIYNLIEELADIQSTVLITGESGTGKELVAEALHYRGVRRNNPLVKVNCSALSETLLESELFGHVKGAFTGAISDKVGRFQKANGGTIFLDEIGDISPRMQLRLLRVLQEREFERVGDSTPIKVDVRIITATNQDLRKKVRLGEFREDLYYRLKVVEIKIPPLRDRQEDIPLLIDHLLQKLDNKLNKGVKGVSQDVLKIFMDYQWPGNVRELEHTLEHASILCRQDTISYHDLPADFKEYIEAKAPLLREKKGDEREAILQALEKTDWNKAKGARLLGISRRTIYRKIKEYNITETE